jgi:hypothetical protein
MRLLQVGSHFCRNCMCVPKGAFLTKTVAKNYSSLFFDCFLHGNSTNATDDARAKCHRMARPGLDHATKEGIAILHDSNLLAHGVKQVVEIFVGRGWMIRPVNQGCWPLSSSLLQNDVDNKVGSVDKHASVNQDWASKSEEDPFWWTKELNGTGTGGDAPNDTSWAKDGDDIVEKK